MFSILKGRRDEIMHENNNLNRDVNLTRSIKPDGLIDLVQLVVLSGSETFIGKLLF